MLSPTPSARAAVLGSPVAHSLSPQLHLAAYRALGLEEWSYDRVEVDEAGFARFLVGLGPEWRGLSLTMPLKEVVLGCGVVPSELAERAGSANTLVRLPDGGWAAHNTDVHGVLAALREAGVDPAAAQDPGSAPLVLGSGATARSVLLALHALGARAVVLAVRGRPRERTLALAADLGLELRSIPLAGAAPRVAGAPVVVSTLPPAGARAVAADVQAFAAHGPAGHGPAGRGPAGRGPAGTGPAPIRVLLDVVYADWPTPLARAYAAGGGQVVSGFEMLLHQGAEQVALMTGREAPLDAMRAAGLAALAGRTGGPGTAG